MVSRLSAEQIHNVTAACQHSAENTLHALGRAEEAPSTRSATGLGWWASEGGLWAHWLMDEAANCFTLCSPPGMRMLVDWPGSVMSKEGSHSAYAFSFLTIKAWRS